MRLATLRRRIALALCPELGRREASALPEPIWERGRRPAWWSDIGIRRFLTGAHRQMTLAEVVAEGRDLFGPKFPSKSAVHRYWQRLDRVVGPADQRGAA